MIAVMLTHCLWYCHNDKVIVNVESIYLMKVEQHIGSVDPQNKSSDFAVSPSVGCYNLIHPPSTSLLSLKVILISSGS